MKSRFEINQIVVCVNDDWNPDRDVIDKTKPKIGDALVVTAIGIDFSEPSLGGVPYIQMLGYHDWFYERNFEPIEARIDLSLFDSGEIA